MKNLKLMLMTLGILTISSLSFANTTSAPKENTTASEEYVDPDAADYNRIQNLLAKKYNTKYGFKSLDLSAGAKTLDVSLYTTKKRISRKTFNKIAKEIANTVRKERQVNVKVGVCYLLQKTPKDNAITVYAGNF